MSDLICPDCGSPIDPAYVFRDGTLWCQTCHPLISNSQRNAFAAMNTLRAGFWTLVLAQLFGRHLVCVDAGEGPDETVTVTLYRWKGKYYMTDFKKEVRPVK